MCDTPLRRERGPGVGGGGGGGGGGGYPHQCSIIALYSLSWAATRSLSQQQVKASLPGRADAEGGGTTAAGWTGPTVASLVANQVVT